MTALTTSPAGLRATMRGNLLGPDDPGYEAARSLWNGAIDRRPAYIARCAGADDVVAALAFARRSGLEIAVRGGGHSAAGASSVDGGLVIDLSGLQTVRVDPQERRAFCGGGATMAVLDAATQAHGLAVTGGTISHTGVGGLALGGGYGWLLRSAGLLIDNLVSAQVVLADGAVVRARADEHPELFWALRGGGGNFGVVTDFEFRLHPVGPLVHMTMLFWELARCAEALHAAREVCHALPRHAGAMLAATHAAPAAFVPTQWHGAPGILCALVGFGDAEAHQAHVAALRRALPPLYERAARMPYTALQQMIDHTGPWGMRAYSKGLFLPELTDEAIQVIADHLPARRSPLSVMPMFPLGGAYADVTDDDTALAGSRSARFNISIDAIADNEELFKADRDWARSLWQSLRPLAGNCGEYVNFMADYEDGRVHAAYGSKYERLSRIKARYDPDNVFHRNANIQPGHRS